jgi:hypothetical protein
MDEHLVADNTLFSTVISGKKEHKEKSVSLDKMGCTPT